jgi:3,4-dihydroxy 2-butanone 4-phosphate synthase/GTP cyclohydrolase II
VGREPLPVRPYPESMAYLRTKRDRMGHLIDELDEIVDGLA